MVEGSRISQLTDSGPLDGSEKTLALKNDGKLYTVQTQRYLLQNSAAVAAVNAALLSFNELWLGTLPAAPTAGPGGVALVNGAIYYDTTLQTFRTYDLPSTTWHSLLGTLPSGATNGQVLIWGTGGPAWGDAPPSGASAFADLTDVTVTFDGAHDGFVVRYNDATKKLVLVHLADVAFSGSYNDLTDKPSVVPSGGADGQVLGHAAGVPAWTAPALPTDNPAHVGRMLVVQPDGTLSAQSDVDQPGARSAQQWRINFKSFANSSTFFTVDELQFRTVAGTAETPSGGTPSGVNMDYIGTPSQAFDGNTGTYARTDGEPGILAYAFAASRLVVEIAMHVNVWGSQACTSFDVEFFDVATSTWVVATTFSGLTQSSWNSGGWTTWAVPVSAGSGARINVENARDVNFAFSALNDGKYVKYDNASGKLVPAPPPSSLPTGGSAGQVLTKNSGTDGDASWQSPSGGGGGGGGGGSTLTPPDPADFTWTNQSGCAAVLVTNGDPPNMNVQTSSNGTNNSAYFWQNAPSAPYKITAKIRTLFPGTAPSWMGNSIAVFNSTSLKAVRALALSDDQFKYFSGHWNSPTSWASNPINGAYYVDQIFWHQIENDGTNLNMKISLDGRSWVTVSTETIASFIGSIDKVGLMFANNSGGTVQVAIDHFHVGTDEGF